ncbi:MAG: hypothetical protein JWM26_2843, partial [Betaproteobacteria bacterium]|nr:hypothetical protein [Betaproteobacteria bacterium]
LPFDKLRTGFVTVLLAMTISVTSHPAAGFE